MSDVYEITKEIVLKIIEKDCLTFEQYPEAKSYVDLVCESYKQVFKTVSSPK